MRAATPRAVSDRAAAGPSRPGRAAGDRASAIATRLRAIYDYGADAVPANERKRVQVGNLLALAGLTVTGLYSLAYLLLGSPLAFAVNSACALCYLLNFALLARGRPVAARVAISLVFLANILCAVVLFFGPRSGLHLYYIVGGPIAFFLFDRSHRRWRHGFSAMSVLLFFLCEWAPSWQLLGELPDAVYRAMTVSTVPGVILMLLLIQNAFLVELAEREAALDTAARTDPLTGLPNRRAVLEQARALFERSRRHGIALTVMMIDVDHFKRINDGHGHAAGDEVLVRAAAALRGVLRGEDMLGRFGGEEFVAVLSHVQGDGDLQVAEALRARAALSPGEGGAVPGCTISIGLARRRRDDASLEAVLARADRALYRAKAEGRNRAVLDDGPSA